MSLDGLPRIHPVASLTGLMPRPQGAPEAPAPEALQPGKPVRLPGSAWGREGGQGVFTESRPGSTGEEEELFPLILPPPPGSLSWHCRRPEKGWDFGKVKVYHCVS